MPDWFYRTVSRSMLFRLPAETSRDFAIGVMGTLARAPLGGFVIDLMGHMRPDPRLQRTALGVTFPTGVGLGVGVDARAYGLPALQRFGFGYLEVGPVAVSPVDNAGAVQRRPDRQALWYPEPPGAIALEDLTRRLQRWVPRIPLIVRLAVNPSAGAEQAQEECHALIDALAPNTALFSLTTTNRLLQGEWSESQWREHVIANAEKTRQSPASGLLICLPADLEHHRIKDIVDPISDLDTTGILIDGAIAAESSGRLLGPPAFDPALQLLQQIREHDPKLAVFVAGGIHEPEQALQLFAAGADMVQIESGLVYSGPGLPKRINEAMLWDIIKRVGSREQGVGEERIQSKLPTPYSLTPTPVSTPPLTQSTWFWTMLMGLAMFFGGLLALGIACTRVVLPYDEWEVEMTRVQLVEVNPRLLLFMAHDRVTLSGTMLAVGILYTSLSWFAVRKGVHWARVTILASAFSGFFSFFLFLGFGYFDPFHAFVTAVLFQFLLLALYSKLPLQQMTTPPNLREDWRWRLCQWGQFLYILHGMILIVAGCVISIVGITHVFVPEDLDFMQTTAAELQMKNARIIPLVAHDRATFGGMLIATGVTVLLSSLWGFRQGYRWQWWSLLSAGATAYVATIWVHLAVGYTHFNHLLPAYGGLGILALSAALTYPFLCGRTT